MKSIGAMIQQIDGLHDEDFTTWELNFFDSVLVRSSHGKNTTKLSEKQVEVIERLYNKHFGDSE